MKKIGVLLLLMTSFSAVAEPIGDSTRKYATDLGIIDGFLASIFDSVAACNEIEPGFEKINTTALENWKERNKASLEEIRYRVHEFWSEQTGHDETRMRAAMQQQEIKSQKELASMRSELLTMPVSSRKEVCSGYAAKLSTSLSSLEDVMQSQLQTIRKKEMPAWPNNSVKAGSLDGKRP